MNADHLDVQRVLAALGNSSRFRLAVELASGRKYVGELAIAVGLSQSCTTRHIQAMERVGIVRSERAGKRVLVGLLADRPEVSALLAWLEHSVGVVHPARGTRLGATRARAQKPKARHDSRRSAHGASVGPTVVGVPALAPDRPNSSVADSGTPETPLVEPIGRRWRTDEPLEDYLL